MMYGLVSTDAEPPSLVDFDPADPGPIPPDSPVRVVHADLAMFIGGVRALLLQTLHPDAMHAVAEHSAYETDPLGRLQRTAEFLGTTTYGSGTEAAQAIQAVRAIHARVVGTLADGTPYRADDPHLLAWIHATEVDSFMAAYDRYGAGTLCAHDRDRYVADMAAIGEALGMVDAPRSSAELDAVLTDFGPELAATEACRDATRFLFAPQLPLAVLPAYGVIFGAAATLLPGWARSMLMLPVPPGLDRLVVRPAARTLTATMRWAAADLTARSTNPPTAPAEAAAGVVDSELVG